MLEGDAAGGNIRLMPTRTPTGFLIALGVAVAASGCSDNGTAASVEGDAQRDAVPPPEDAAVSDSTTVVDGAVTSEGGACPLAPTDMQTCNAVPQQSPTITSSCVPAALPPAEGGIVEDGTYVLQSLTYYGGPCPPSPDVERITWVVCGTQWELVEDLVAPDGGVDVVRLNLARPAQGSMLTSNITCKPGATKPVMADPQAYTASPGRFSVQIKAASGTRIDTFIKR
jgi:hypothetical protein